MIEVVVTSNDKKHVSHLNCSNDLLQSAAICSCIYNNEICSNGKKSDVPFIHLQWFAPEDEGRTEDPTEHKLKEARKEGKVAKTTEFPAALVLIFSVILIAFLSRFMFINLMDMFKYFFSISSETDMTTTNNILPVFLNFFLKMFIPVAAIAFIAALAGNLMQVGFMVSTKPITPDLNKISPNFPKYFQRAFFSAEALWNFGKTMFKVSAIGVIVYLNLRFEADRLLTLGERTLQFSLRYILIVSFKLIIEAAVFLLILSIPDYMFQRRQHRKSLKMSKHEIKEEMKQLEGDPRIKDMLVRRMRELLNNKNIEKNVPLSNVVITNPTHYSVAIKYERYTMSVPIVYAKGEDRLALRIREIAKENNIPIMENKPLARALYSEVEVGQQIPEEYFELIIAVLKEVYELTGKI